MAPRIKITREKIIIAAVAIVRASGEAGLNARDIAAALGCSTQPIFSNFATMEELRSAVLEKAHLIYQDYEKSEVESGKFPAYKASGMAYIRFAKEEKELFKLLYMCDRSTLSIPKSVEDDFGRMKGVVQKNTGLDEGKTGLFHLEMWMYVHGIATMFATGFLDLEWELISSMLSDSYMGLRKQFGMED